MFVFFNVSGGALIIKVHRKSRGEAFFLPSLTSGRMCERKKEGTPEKEAAGLITAELCGRGSFEFISPAGDI